MRTGVRYQVNELVPHRDAMSLLDRIEDYGEDWLRAAVEVRPGGTFAGEHGVPGWVGIEYMAQAAAAFGGLDQVQRGEQPSIGLLIGARYYQCMLDWFPLGSTLIVTAKIAMRDSEDFAAYDCEIELRRERVASTTLKAYRPKDIRDWLPDRIL